MKKEFSPDMRMPTKSVTMHQAIRLDDASDPSAATRNARKLVEEEKVDVLMGTSGVPGTIAMVVVATETKTPIISLTPASQPQSPNGQWLRPFHSRRP